jgi:hypothetical protein
MLRRRNIRSMSLITDRNDNRGKISVEKYFSSNNQEDGFSETATC